MIADLRPYPAMKDSGLLWVGEVPEHWEVVPLKHWLWVNRSVLPEDTEQSFGFDYLDIGSVGTGRLTEKPKWMRFGTAPSRARRVVTQGDTIVSTVRTYLKAVWYAEKVDDELIASTGFAVLSPREDTVPKYVSYLAQSNAFTQRVTAESVGIAYPAISESRFGTFKVPVPPLAEQTAIVRYLDHVDRRVRRLMRAKRKLIALLTEQKQAIIHRAVTRGLDPEVPLKDSAVEWLGEVPEHWEVVRSSHLIKLTTGFPFKSDGFTQSKEDIRLLRGVNVSPGALRWNEVVRWPEVERGVFRDFELELGDIVLGMDRPIISAGIRVAPVREEDLPCLLLQRVARIRPRESVDADFLLLLLAGQAFEDYLTPIFTGISVPHLSPEQIRSFRVATPPKCEQTAIVEYLEKATADFSSAIDRAQRATKLLNEYRTRLIADVVTGKLDVREASARLPKVDPLAAEAEPGDLDAIPEEASA